MYNGIINQMKQKQIKLNKSKNNLKKSKKIEQNRRKTNTMGGNWKKLTTNKQRKSKKIKN